MMLPYCAFLPVSRLVLACSTVTGAWNAMLPRRPAQTPIVGRRSAAAADGLPAIKRDGAPRVIGCSGEICNAGRWCEQCEARPRGRFASHFASEAAHAPHRPAYPGQRYTT